MKVWKGVMELINLIHKLIQGQPPNDKLKGSLERHPKLWLAPNTSSDVPSKI
jgi:hypothetical protein